MQGSQPPSLQRGWTNPCFAKRLSKSLQGICASGEPSAPARRLDVFGRGCSPGGQIFERRGAAVRDPGPGAQGFAADQPDLHTGTFHPGDWRRGAGRGQRTDRSRRPADQPQPEAAPVDPAAPCRWPRRHCPERAHRSRPRHLLRPRSWALPDLPDELAAQWFPRPYGGTIRPGAGRRQPRACNPMALPTAVMFDLLSGAGRRVILPLPLSTFKPHMWLDRKAWRSATSAPGDDLLPDRLCAAALITDRTRRSCRSRAQSPRGRGIPGRAFCAPFSTGADCDAASAWFLAEPTRVFSRRAAKARRMTSFTDSRLAQHPDPSYFSPGLQLTGHRVGAPDGVGSALRLAGV